MTCGIHTVVNVQAAAGGNWIFPPRSLPVCLEQGAQRMSNESEHPERARAEGPPSSEHVAHRNRLYRVLSGISRAMVYAQDPQGLYQEICRIAVVEGAFVMAWVGLVDQDTERVRPVAWNGAEDGYLENIHVSLRSDCQEGCGPTGVAVREGRFVTSTSVAHDPQMVPWREEALSRGYQSSASFPFRSGGQVLGALTVYSDVPGFFSAEEIELLEDMMVGLSFALDKMAAESAREASQREVIRLNAELEERVRERTARLEAANRDLETFAYSVSHDLRSPLTAVDGFSQILKEDFSEALGEDGRRYLQAILDSVARMHGLIEGLLGLCRVGRSALQPCQVDLSEMSRSVMSHLVAAAPQRSVSVCIQPDAVAWGDPDLLRVVMQNLLQNAFKFTSACNSARIEFLVEETEEGRSYVVRDNGAGFDMRYVDRVFIPFERLHSSSDFPGSGIGLATVRRIVELHGGTVSIEGAPDQGCRVAFSLGLPS